MKKTKQFAEMNARAANKSDGRMTYVVTHFTKNGTLAKRVNRQFDLFIDKDKAEKRAASLMEMNPGDEFVVANFDRSYFTLYETH